MPPARAKVVKGKIVTRAKFPEGTKLLLVVEEAQPTAEIALDAEDEQAFNEGSAEARAGKTISLDAFRAILQRL